MAAATIPPVHDSAVASIKRSSRSLLPARMASWWTTLSVAMAKPRVGAGGNVRCRQHGNQMVMRHSAITSSVKNAAAISSNMMPKPPFNRRSKYRMGGGFTMSKKRNTMNAHNCPVNVAGVTNNNTSQNAMISSHTTGDGSEMPIFFAVKPQNQQPATNPTAISTAHSATVRCGLNTTNDTPPNKGPTL